MYGITYGVSCSLWYRFHILYVVYDTCYVWYRLDSRYQLGYRIDAVRACPYHKPKMSLTTHHHRPTMAQTWPCHKFIIAVSWQIGDAA